MTIFQPTKDLIVGVKQTVTWGTPLSANVASGRLAIEKEEIKMKQTPYEQKVLVGQTLQLQDQPGNMEFEGTIEFPVDFDVAMFIIGMWFGTYSAPVQQAATTAYAAVLSINQNIMGKMFTMALAKNVDLEEYDSCKVTKIVLKYEMGKPVYCTATIVARARAWAASATYPSTTAALNGTCTFKTTPLNLAMINVAANFAVRINDQSAGALGAGDEVEASMVEITFERNMKKFFTGTHIPYINEPPDNGWPKITGKATLPEFQAIKYMEDAESQVKKKMDITVTGPIIATIYPYLFNLRIPQLQFNSPTDNASGEATVPMELDFKCTTAAAAPTGMTLTSPYIDVVNMWAAAPVS